MMTGALVLFVVVGCVVMALYRCAILPMLRDSIRHQVFELRDIVRNSRYESGDHGNEFCFDFLESRLNSMTHQSDKINIGIFISVVARHKVGDRTAELAKFEKEATHELKALYRTAIMSMIKVMLLNSPLIFVLGAMCVVLKQATVFVFSELMWEELAHKHAYREQGLAHA